MDPRRVRAVRPLVGLQTPDTQTPACGHLFSRQKADAAHKDGDTPRCTTPAHPAHTLGCLFRLKDRLEATLGFLYDSCALLPLLYHFSLN